MLTKTLGFESRNVDMLYYDVEPKGGPSYCLHGQQAPTASRFKAKFTALIKSAKPGDVRFLYVDAENVSGASGEPGLDDGWDLAKRDDGQETETVLDSWITKTTRQVSKRLTIYTAISKSKSTVSEREGQLNDNVLPLPRGRLARYSQ